MFAGWGRRIRTFAMSESESDALPLGDAPIEQINTNKIWIVCQGRNTVL